MKTIPLLILIFSLITLTLKAELNSRYVATNSSQATLSFQNRIEFESATPPTEALAKKKIDFQLAHLFGTMESARYRAVPYRNHKISEISINSLGGTRYEALYQYEGTIVLQNGPTQQYEVILPIAPDEVYPASLFGGSSPCTDAEHNSASMFWYYWNPYRTHCPLREGRDFARVAGTIQRIANSPTTYPEYHRLASPSKVIPIHLFFGIAEQMQYPNPLESNDENANNFRRVREQLMQMGYHGKVWSGAELQAVCGNTVLPYVEEYHQTFSKGTVVVRLFYGQTGLSESSRGFHYFLKAALEKAAIVIYDGHSGLGSNLNLTRIEAMEQFKITLPTDRYQMVFFNSCSSYPYYTSMYFDRKKTATDPAGTKNLDLLTNGLLTYFSVMGNGSLTLIKAVQNWAQFSSWTSFQSIAAYIDSNNLFGINGDEDNPTSPVQP